MARARVSAATTARVTVCTPRVGRAHRSARHGARRAREKFKVHSSSDDANDDARRDGTASASTSASVDDNDIRQSLFGVDLASVGPGLAPSALTASLGAFAFGYHTAACNAPLDAIANDLAFGGDQGLKGLVVSALVIGGALGGLGVGGVSDALGRRLTLAWTSAPLIAGALMSAYAPNAAVMIAGRFIAGVGVGASSQIVPLYLSEISPPALRGTLNGVRRMAYVFGCLAAFQIGDGLKVTGGEGWWREVFIDATFPAVFLAVGAMTIAQESPVWLLTRQDEASVKQSRKALAILQNIRGRNARAWQNSLMSAAAAPFSVDEGDEETEEKSCPRETPTVSSWGDLISQERNRLPLSIGVTLCGLSAFSGANTVIFYASTVFTSVGINNADILTWAVGVPNVIGGFVALALSDKIGRRPLLLASFSGMSACLGFLAFAAFLTPQNMPINAYCADPNLGVLVGALNPPIDDGLYSYPTLSAAQIICVDLGTDLTAMGPAQPEAVVALVTIPLYVLFFSLGAGPIPWLLYNEVFPTRIRARAVSACTALNYAANSIIGATFLPMVSAYGLSGSYGLYTLFCAAGYVFVDRYVPETKGVPLEDVEALLRRTAHGKSLEASD